MNKYLKLSIVLAGAFSALQAGRVTSHTFFSVRPNFQSGMPERVSLFRDELLDECKNGCGGAFQAVFYGGRTTCESALKVGQFFMPFACGGNCINVKEYNQGLEATINTCDACSTVGTARSGDYDPTKDVEARNFNIVTNAGLASGTNNVPFESRVCIAPRQEKFGIGLVYKQALTYKCNGRAGLWFEGSLPIERIKNTVNLRESIVSSGNGANFSTVGLDNSLHVGSVTEAFRQKNWRYGKIDDCRSCREKWGVADIELKLGYNTLSCNNATLSSFIGVVVPTGNRVKGHYLWETIIGNNHHFGVLLGNSAGFAIWRRCQYTLAMFFDGCARLYTSNHQVRSFDLVGKPWSRYIETYASSEDANRAYSIAQSNLGTTNVTDAITAGTSGINLFTKCVRVKPHISADFNTAFVLNRQGECSAWQAELGYNFFGRQAETIEIPCCKKLSDVAIKDINGNGSTNLARDIRRNFQNSVVTFNNGYLNLNQCDIDLESASHPATICHIVYGSLGYKWQLCCPWFVTLGGSYEFTTHKSINTALDRWMFWGKFGFAF